MLRAGAGARNCAAQRERKEDRAALHCGRTGTVGLELSERKLKILQALIDEYARTGTPVGSRNLARKGAMALSAATIRNEMADLEDMGYLEKAHASSGRRPNIRAYRLYLDQLLEVSALTPEEMSRARSYFGGGKTEVSEVLDAAAQAISDLTTHVGVVADPETVSVQLKRIQLVQVSESRALAVFVTDSGQVRNSLVPIPPHLSAPRLEEMSNMLSERLLDAPMEEAAARLQKVAQTVNGEQKTVINAVLEAMNNSKDTRRMHLRGRQNIWRYPECRDLGRAERLVSLLDATDSLATLLRQAQDVEFTVRIGAELLDNALPEFSVITAAYSAGGRRTGSFGLIGPIRMDYGRVLSVLRFVGISLSEALSECLAADGQ